jgi:CheY-like chemotaxis protein
VKQQAVILLVEDDVVDVMAIKRAFKRNQISNLLYVVGDGEEAVAFLRHEGKFSVPSSSPRPNLILLDLNMPRMNGLEFLHTIKSDPELCQIPVIVLTTSAEQSDVRTSFQHGVAGYIVKPVTFEKFVQTIATFDFYWTLSELP